MLYILIINIKDILTPLPYKQNTFIKSLDFNIALKIFTYIFNIGYIEYIALCKVLLLIAKKPKRLIFLN